MFKCVILYDFYKKIKICLNRNIRMPINLILVTLQAVNISEVNIFTACNVTGGDQSSVTKTMRISLSRICW